MSEIPPQPEPKDLATTAEYMGWMKGQAFAIAHLWAFQLFFAGYTQEQARKHFDSLIRAYENSGQASFPLGEFQTTVKLMGLSHLEEIFELATLALHDAQNE